MQSGSTRRLNVSYSQEISRPVGDDRMRNLLGWMGKECEDCGIRRRRSQLEVKLDQVDWDRIANGEMPSTMVSVTSKHCSLYKLNTLVSALGYFCV